FFVRWGFWGLGPPASPPAQFRNAIMYVAVATMIGVTVHGLVGALATNARNVARLAPAARSVHTPADSRLEICAAACDVSGAAFALLYEPGATGALHTSATAGIATGTHTIQDHSGRPGTRAPCPPR